MKKFWILISAVCTIAALLRLTTGMTASADPKAYDYLLPEANTRCYTDDEIWNLPPQVITYARNEIYARHGRKFVSPELTAWFAAQPWYYGTVEAGAFDTSVLNSCETVNIATLKKAEQALGADAYTLDRAGWNTQVVDAYLSAQIPGGSAAGSGIADGMEFINIFSTNYFSFNIPDSWIEAGFMTLFDADSISFCCQPAWNASGSEDGCVCTILRQYEYVKPDYFPFATYLGKKNGNYFYLLYPTDVRYDPSDEYAADWYNVMLEAAYEIPSTFVLK